MTPTEKLLTDILSTLRAIQASLAAGSSSGASGSAGADVATDAEMDGPYGDPAIKSDPKRWEGPSFAGCNYSECPPDYLDVVAGFKDWQAGKDDAAKAVDNKNRPKSQWARKDAKLARGWAARKRAGWQAPTRAAQPAGEPSGDYGGASAVDDIPFLTCDATLIGERWWRFQ